MGSKVLRMIRDPLIVPRHGGHGDLEKSIPISCKQHIYNGLPPNSDGLPPILMQTTSLKWDHGKLMQLASGSLSKVFSHLLVTGLQATVIQPNHLRRRRRLG